MEFKNYLMGGLAATGALFFWLLMRYLLSEGLAKTDKPFILKMFGLKK